MTDLVKEPSVLIYGTGVIGGGIAKILSQTTNVILYNRNFAKAETLALSIGAVAQADKNEALAGADIIILAVKPQDLLTASHELKDRLKKEQILISVVTGANLEQLKSYFGSPKIIRAMLNLPALYSHGTIGLVSHEGVNASDQKKAESLFQKMGHVLWLSEGKLDAFTALSGSGPAFILIFYEAMIDAAIALGIPVDLGKQIAAETLSGTAEMIKQSQEHPGTLRWKISSPGGCTIAGTKHLEDESFRSAVINTFLATHDRIKEF